MHQSGHEHTSCYSTCSSTNNLYVPRCLILRVNFEKKKSVSPAICALVGHCKAYSGSSLRLASSKRKRRVSSREAVSLCTCTYICAQSALPVAVMRFQWSANRRVKFSNFVRLPIQRRILSRLRRHMTCAPVTVCSGTSHPRSGQEGKPSDFWRYGQSLPHDKYDCTPTHRLV
jgi:hypothetical protein